MRRVGRGIRKLSILMIIAGVTLMLYPRLTSIYAWYEQNRLAASIEEEGLRQDVEPESPENDEEPTIISPLPSPVEKAENEHKAGIIEIPNLKLKAVVLEGTSRDILRKGPGRYEESALPGEGNTAIAAHRTMYGAWFRHLDRLEKDDYVIVKYDGCVYFYQVEGAFPVEKNDWSVIEDCGYPALTLTTCHPVGSARQRLVVRAKLVSIEEGD